MTVADRWLLLYILGAKTRGEKRSLLCVLAIARRLYSSLLIIAHLILYFPTDLTFNHCYLRLYTTVRFPIVKMTSTFKKGKTLHSQAREIVSNVTSFFKAEAAAKSLKIPISQATKRAAEAKGVSESAVKKKQ